MKAIVLPVTDSGVPRIQIKPENTQDDAVLNSIINRNGEGVQPDAGYTILSFEVNGDSFQSLTFGRNEEGNSGSPVSILSITAEGVDSYQDDSLIDKTVLMVFTDSAVRVPSDYTFTSNTGTIVFASAIDQDTIIQIIYK